MTYVSRKTRIIISRWPDECDAEYTLRACRRRSDGRLKRHASCDDFRAWVNNSCVRHEHLVELMSDGEVAGKPPFRLYGRFIPVPILFKLTETTRVADNEGETGKVRGSKSETGRQRGRGAASRSLYAKKSNSDSGSLDSRGSFTRLEWEKNVLEKRLCECTCLLNKAVGQLEKIDSIVGCPRSEADHVRNQQIQNAFQRSKQLCTCPPRNTTPEPLSQSRSYLKKLRESAKCAELMRKISCLREKLKNTLKCRREISQQIRLSEIRAENCASSHQVTELYSRREQAYVKRLRKKLEKLIAERGRLLSELCHTLSCLNSLKKSSRSSVSFGKNKSRTIRDSGESQTDSSRQPGDCSCPCTCSEYFDSTDSERVHCSDSSSGETDLNRGYVDCKQFESDLNNGYGAQETPCGGDSADDDSVCSEQFEENDFPSETTGRNPPFPCRTTATTTSVPLKPFKCPTKDAIPSSDDTGDPSSSGKKSRVHFECPQPSCRRVVHPDDLSAYENSLSPEQQALILGAIKNIQNRRPTTSPTTRREREAVAQEQHRACGPQRGTSWECIPERQIKSETTMKEIEKTLRNYEQRLNRLDALECKVEELKQQSSAAGRYKECLERLRGEAKRQSAAEREKSSREISRLCSENWELRRQVQQLSAKFEAQCRRIQSLKCGLAKARELEWEAEELKKKLSEYRDSYENQRECISKWESVVAVQRTEIENLMNHIRKLTTMKEESACAAHQMRKCVQRSRSYSPDMKAKAAAKGAATRAKAPARSHRPSSEEEDAAYCCDEYLQEDNRRRSQQRGSDRVYCCPPPTRRAEWCN